MTQAAATVVRKQILVTAPVERAFELFTARFGEIEPPEHNLLGAPIAETTFEPRVGGHIVDRADDGSECRWARILVFDPPSRVVFSWDIGPTWQLESDPANASEVEVRFTDAGDGRTRVELGDLGIFVRSMCAGRSRVRPAERVSWGPGPGSRGRTGSRRRPRPAGPGSWWCGPRAGRPDR